MLLTINNCGLIIVLVLIIVNLVFLIKTGNIYKAALIFTVLFYIGTISTLIDTIYFISEGNLFIAIVSLFMSVVLSIGLVASLLELVPNSVVIVKKEKDDFN